MKIKLDLVINLKINNLGDLWALCKDDLIAFAEALTGEEAVTTGIQLPEGL